MRTLFFHRFSLKTVPKKFLYFPAAENSWLMSFLSNISPVQGRNENEMIAPHFSKFFLVVHSSLTKIQVICSKEETTNRTKRTQEVQLILTSPSTIIKCKRIHKFHHLPNALSTNQPLYPVSGF